MAILSPAVRVSGQLEKRAVEGGGGLRGVGLEGGTHTSRLPSIVAYWPSCGRILAQSESERGGLAG